MSILSWAIIALLAFYLNQMGQTFVVFLLLGGAAIAALTETPATTMPHGRAGKEDVDEQPQVVVVGGSPTQYPGESRLLFRPDWNDYPGWWYSGQGLANLIMLPFEILIKFLNIGKKAFKEKKEKEEKKD